jgi:hypothetical protein
VLIFFTAVFACRSWSFAQGPATGASGNAVVLGSCNVVLQNVTATGQATINNEINCVPEKPEDSFRAVFKTPEWPSSYKMT